MTFQSYPEYKNSNVEWLGCVPSQWQVVEPRRVFKLRRSPEQMDDVHLTPSQHFGVLPQTEYMHRTGNRVVMNLSGTRMQHVEPHDFISHLRTFQGGLELSYMAGKVSPAYTVVSPLPNVAPGFFKYVFKSQGYISQIASITDQLRDGQTMRFTEFNKTPVPLPSLNEQRAIADFLDRETAEIDAFIADQERLIELLEERRTAMITHAVTKGLNPDAPMKDSGVEWLGLIPAHWTLRPLFSITRQNKTANTGLQEKNVKSLSYGRIVNRDITTNEGLLPESFETYQIIEHNDIVLRLTDLQNDKRSLRTAIARERGIITSAYLSIEPVGIDPDFLAYALRDADLRKVFYSMGSGLRQSMKYKDMKWLPIACPPCPEQQDIVVFLDHETAEIDAAVADAREVIGLLRERRAALISAAVTGQIDVTQQARPVGDESVDDEVWV